MYHLFVLRSGQISAPKSELIDVTLVQGSRLSRFLSLIMRLLGSRLAADGSRACTGQHAIEDVAAEGGFRLLGRK